MFYFAIFTALLLPILLSSLLQSGYHFCCISRFRLQLALTNCRACSRKAHAVSDSCRWFCIVADNAPGKIERRRRFQVVFAHFTYYFIGRRAGLFLAGINGRPWAGICIRCRIFRTFVTTCAKFAHFKLLTIWRLKRLYSTVWQARIGECELSRLQRW